MVISGSGWTADMNGLCPSRKVPPYKERSRFRRLIELLIFLLLLLALVIMGALASRVVRG